MIDCLFKFGCFDFLLVFVHIIKCKLLLVYTCKNGSKYHQTKQLVLECGHGGGGGCHTLAPYIWIST